MKLLFIDESGFSRNWTQDIAQQPFYVLAGVCIDASEYAAACDDLRTKVECLNLPDLEFRLGQGSEIKARDVARGDGWWGNHNEQRNRFRDLMLGFPAEYGGAAFITVIDKARHRDQYAYPEDPVSMAMKYLFERVERYLRETDSHVFCIYDHDTWRTDSLHEESMSLIREGSRVIYFSRFSGERMETTNILDRILEMALGTSENSVGLQVADFFCTCAYFHFKSGRPENCGWWDHLCCSLHRQNNVLEGYGLKVFPI